MLKTSLDKREAQVPAQVEQTETVPTSIPRVDIWETPAAIRVLADMPGVDDKNVRIDLDRNLLTIRGLITAKNPGECKLVYREYESGHFERSFTLGDTIDRNGVEAHMKNGVLQLHLPKLKAVQPRRIEVKVG